MQDLLESGESDKGSWSKSSPTAPPRCASATTPTVNPGTGTHSPPTYRIGNGTAGNVGAESLILDRPRRRIQSCTNPLPATGGIDPETTDQIRRRAPQAFLTQERAVTMADYEHGGTEPQVEHAVATLRWTGSWYTVFITAEPRGGGNLLPTLKRSLVSLQPLSPGRPGHRAGIAAVRLAARSS